jgi:hypothetical protein
MLSSKVHFHMLLYLHPVFPETWWCPLVRCSNFCTLFSSISQLIFDTSCLKLSSHLSTVTLGGTCFMKPCLKVVTYVRHSLPCAWCFMNPITYSFWYDIFLSTKQHSYLKHTHRIIKKTHTKNRDRNRTLYVFCRTRVSQEIRICDSLTVWVLVMMMTEMDIETSVYNVHLTRLIAREDFIKFTDWLMKSPSLFSYDKFAHTD